MSEKEKNLLKAAYVGLGLSVCQRHDVYGVFDDAGNRYSCVYADGTARGKAPTDRAGGLSDFARVKLFESYHFPGHLKIVKNRFFGMSREELELKLAVMGK